MEYINSVHLRGRVSSIKIQQLSTIRIAHIAIATELTYENGAGNCIGEVTFHSITAYEGKKICVDFTVGDPIDVKGRIKCTRFVGMDGKERSVWEIVATEVTKLK